MLRATDSLSSADKDFLIGQLLARIDVMTRAAEVMSARMLLMETSYAALQAENTQLRAKLDLPPKTPDNSSLPPSNGQKPNLPDRPKHPRRGRPGVSRALAERPDRIIEATLAACPR